MPSFFIDNRMTEVYLYIHRKYFKIYTEDYLKCFT